MAPQIDRQLILLGVEAEPVVREMIGFGELLDSDAKIPERLLGPALLIGCGSFAATPHILVFQSLIVHSLGIRLFPQKAVAAVVEPWASLRIWPGDCVDIPVVRGNPSTRRNHH
jgi:hypothetical protein